MKEIKLYYIVYVYKYTECANGVLTTCPVDNFFRSPQLLSECVWNLFIEKEKLKYHKVLLKKETLFKNINSKAAGNDECNRKNNYENLNKSPGQKCIVLRNIVLYCCIYTYKNKFRKNRLEKKLSSRTNTQGTHYIIYRIGT